MAMIEEILALKKERQATILAHNYQVPEVQEVADLRYKHLELEGQPRVQLHGKGDKWRVCPLWKETVTLLQQLVAEQNAYLAGHPRADVTVARRKIEARHKLLRLPKIAVRVNGRTLSIAKEEHAWQEAAKLDGCYCLKTDLSVQRASKETVHYRYKDLSQVEWAFRTSKTTLLEARPIYVALESRTRGHLLRSNRETIESILDVYSLNVVSDKSCFSRLLHWNYSSLSKRLIELTNHFVFLPLHFLDIIPFIMA